MPLPLLDIQNDTAGLHVDGFGQVAVVVVDVFDEVAADADAGLA